MLVEVDGLVEIAPKRVEKRDIERRVWDLLKFVGRSGSLNIG